MICQTLLNNIWLCFLAPHGGRWAKETRFQWRRTPPSSFPAIQSIPNTGCFMSSPAYRSRFHQRWGQKHRSQSSCTGRKASKVIARPSLSTACPRAYLQLKLDCVSMQQWIANEWLMIVKSRLFHHHLMKTFSESERESSEGMRNPTVLLLKTSWDSFIPIVSNWGIIMPLFHIYDNYTVVVLYIFSRISILFVKTMRDSTLTFIWIFFIFFFPLEHKDCVILKWFLLTRIGTTWK